MAIPTTYSFTRYLAAKKSVDDRALNRHVWQRLGQALPEVVSDRAVQVLEIGAGIGTMVERVVEWRLLQQATYTAIDIDPETIIEGRHRLPTWMNAHGFDQREQTISTREGFPHGRREIVSLRPRYRPPSISSPAGGESRHGIC